MPDWLTYLLFAVLFVWGLYERAQRTRAAGVAIRTAKIDVAKGALDVLRASSDDQQAHLQAITEALGADSPARPDLATLDRVEKTAQANGDVKSESLVRHLRSRERARAALPGVVSKLDNIRARRLALENELTAGLVVGDDDIYSLRRDVHNLVDEVARLVRQVAESPRIYLTDVAPEDPAEGDLWVDLSSPLTAPPPSTPPTP